MPTKHETVGASVPAELIRKAVAAGRREIPGASIAAVVRLALARLAGLPDESADMPQGRPRTRDRKQTAA